MLVPRVWMYLDGTFQVYVPASVILDVQSQSVVIWINLKTFFVILPAFDDVFISGQAERIHQSFKDPPAATVRDYKLRMKIFRRVCDKIREWLKIFVVEPGRLS